MSLLACCIKASVAAAAACAAAALRSLKLLAFWLI
jgi:hypothetical protein